MTHPCCNIIHDKKQQQHIYNFLHLAILQDCNLTMCTIRGKQHVHVMVTSNWIYDMVIGTRPMGRSAHVLMLSFHVVNYNTPLMDASYNEKKDWA